MRGIELGATEADSKMGSSHSYVLVFGPKWRWCKVADGNLKYSLSNPVLH